MSTRTVVIENFVPRTPPPAQQSAAYKIFHHEFAASVPYMYIYSEEYIRQSGVVTTDNAVYDAKLPTTLVGGRWTPAQLAMFLDEGATIRLDNPADAKVVYDMVFQHLEDWHNAIRNTGTFDFIGPPERELMMLSRLADNLYGYAARFFTQERPRGSLARRFDQIRGRNAKLGSGRKRVDPNAPVPEQSKQKMADHNGFTQTILGAKGVGGSNRWS
ncbi:hypothetical protein LUCX_123 [Xanthomonas phage vB_XciM_LucasX]|nr:hypothetical protein LUCX_123 [Xanthomonas phage vB_XciM_LucasX]